MKQPLGDEVQEVEAEFGILHIKLLDLIVADPKQLTVLRTFDRSGARLVRIQEAKLAKDLSGFNRDPSLLDPEPA